MPFAIMITEKKKNTSKYIITSPRHPFRSTLRITGKELLLRFIPKYLRCFIGAMNPPRDRDLAFTSSRKRWPNFQAPFTFVQPLAREVHFQFLFPSNEQQNLTVNFRP